MMEIIVPIVLLDICMSLTSRVNGILFFWMIDMQQFTVI